MMKYATLLLGASLVLGTAANAANTVATLSFTGATLTDGGTMRGSFTYTYDDVTSSLISLDSALVTTNGGGAFPAVSWIYNVPGKTNNLIDINLQDYQGSSHQFGLFQYDAGVGYGHLIYAPFAGVGVGASLIVGNANFASNLLCMGDPNCTSTQLLSAGTSTGVLGTGAVPEPESWMMLIAGFGIVGAARRRQRSARVVPA